MAVQVTFTRVDVFNEVELSVADPNGWRSHHQWCPEHKLVHTPHKTPRRRQSSVIRTTGSPRMTAPASPSAEGLRRPAGPRLLKQLNKDQIVFLGNSLFSLELVNISTIYKEVLIADIAAVMLNNPGCGCTGEQTPCDPDHHMFGPELFPGPVGVHGAAGGAHGGADIGSLLGTHQKDAPVTQPETQFVRPELPPASLNQVIPATEQRQSFLASLTASPSRVLQQSQRDNLRTLHGVNISSPPATTAPPPPPSAAAPGLGGILATGGNSHLPPPANYGPPLLPRGSGPPPPVHNGSISNTGVGLMASSGLLPPAHSLLTPNHFASTLPGYSGSWPGGTPYGIPPGVTQHQAPASSAPAWPPVPPPGQPASSAHTVFNPSPYGNVSHLPQYHQPAAPPPPPPNSDPASSLAWMMQQMELNRAEERQMREREMAAQRERDLAQQQAHQQVLLAALAGRQGLPGGHGVVPGVLDDLINPSRGKFGIANRINPAADKESGATLSIQYGLFGDLSNVDISSAKHKIKSGENGGDDDEILFKEAWPNQFLNRQMFKGKVKHHELDIGKFSLGFVTKIYCDMPVSVKGTPYHNMTRILIYLLRLAVTCSWDDVLAIDRSLFQALERRQVSWASWPDLEAWWKQAMDTMEFERLGKATNQANPTTTAKRQGTALSGAPPAKVQKGTTCGIPNSWLKEQSLCIKFNLGRCSTSAPHPSPVDESVSLRHLCAGCLRLNKGSDGGHGASKCPNKPRSGFFA